MAKENGFGAKFMHWYESYQGKHVVNIVYSAGASVVIIGALFKILHWPGASMVLMVGMFTEAFLFLIGVLEKPHEEFHWANVFPQLLEYGAPIDRLAKAEAQACPTLLGAGSENGTVTTENKSKTNVPSLSTEDMEALKGGINNLAATAVQLSELGKLATVTTKLGEKMETAATAADQFATSAQTIGQKNAELAGAYDKVVVDMQTVVEGTKAYQQSVATLGTKLGSLNSIYELQINNIQAQADAYKAQTEKINGVTAKVEAMTSNIEKMHTASDEALKSSEDYKAATKKLSEQIADLNKIYGNMLSALA